MSIQTHRDNLLLALQHLETYAKAQLGAAGDELLSKFRQTVDFFHGDLGTSETLRSQLTEVSDMLASETQRADNNAAELQQFKQHVADTAEAAPPAVEGDAQAGTPGEDATLVAEAAAKVHTGYNALLLKMREFGELPTELSTLVEETTAAVDALVMLVPQAEQAPTETSGEQSTSG